MIRIQLVLLLFCAAMSTQVVAIAPPASQNMQVKPTDPAASGLTSGFPHQIAGEALYSYTDFNFNSTTINNYNRFQGHTNLYSLGADHLVYNSSLFAGIYIFKVDTGVNSQILLDPNPIVNSAQTIHNNTLFGHITKSFNPQFYVDLAGALGQNKTSYLTLNMLTGQPMALGQANYSYNNWFTSLNAVYKKPWKKLLFKTSAGVLYSQINNASYQFTSGLTSLTVAALINKATLIVENLEINYELTSEIVPFINGGLIQVASYTNSRPLLITPINGSIPQLNLNQNAFKLGGGFTCVGKQFTLRLEEKYYNACGIYKSWQTLAGMEYRFG